MPAGVAMAQGVHHEGSFQTVYAAQSGSTTATSILNLVAGDLNATNDFSFDVIYHDNVEEVILLQTELHFDSRVLEFVGVTSLNRSASGNPTTDHFVPKSNEALLSLSVLPGTNPDTDLQIYPTWTESDSTKTLFDSSPLKLFTVTFKLKPETQTQTKIEFTNSRSRALGVEAFISTTLAIIPLSNRAPVAQGTIAPLTLTAGGTADTRDVSGNFNSPDGNTLTYTVSSSDTATATVTVAGSIVTVMRGTTTGGTVTITVAATDMARQVATQTFTVRVATSSSQATAFITTWITTKDDESITIPTRGTGYNYNVDCDNDGTNGEINGKINHTGNVDCTYRVAGTHTVAITGTFPRIRFADDKDNDNAGKINSIEQWGTQAWTSMEGAFINTSNLTINATDAPNLRSVKDMSYMFENSGITTPNLSKWNVSAVTNMQQMFRGATAFNSDLSTWDISLVANMDFMFDNASAFDSNLSNWDVSSVRRMNNMFNNATAFNSDISRWDVSSVTSMTDIFTGATAFSQNLGEWYITPATLSIADGSTTPSPEITPQNAFLAGQTPTYSLVPGPGSADNDLFTFNGNALAFRNTTDNASKGSYAVRIGSARGFGTNNARAITISAPIAPLTLVAGGATNIVDVSGNFRVPDGDTLTYKASSSDTDVAMVTVIGSTVTVMPGTTMGTATITVSATDTAMQSATRTFLVTVARFTLDVDDNGMADSRDGVMILRYLLSTTGPELTKGQSTMPFAKIQENILWGMVSKALDVDNSSEVPNPRDGIMILRYLRNTRDSALTANQSATPFNEVEGRIEALK